MVFAMIMLLKKWWNSSENARSRYNAYLLKQRWQEKLSKADIEAKIVQVELKESEDVLNQDEKLREIMRSKTIDLEELLWV